MAVIGGRRMQRWFAVRCGHGDFSHQRKNKIGMTERESEPVTYRLPRRTSLTRTSRFALKTGISAQVSSCDRPLIQDTRSHVLQRLYPKVAFFTQQISILFLIFLVFFFFFCLIKIQTGFGTTVMSGKLCSCGTHR